MIGRTKNVKTFSKISEDLQLLLRQLGPTLKYPHSSDIKGSKHTHLRELRIQHAGQPLRVLYAFDPRRVGVPVNRREQDR
jgi:hypothetical protein